MARRRIDDDDDDDDADDLDDEEERPSRRSRIDRGATEKPGKVQAIGVLSLVGGIVSIMVAIAWMGSGVITGAIGAAAMCPCGCLVLLWPGIYYALVAGVLAIIKGSFLMGQHAYQNHPPIYVGVMLIINIINGDFISLVLGILILVFCADEEVKNYLTG